MDLEELRQRREDYSAMAKDNNKDLAMLSGALTSLAHCYIARAEALAAGKPALYVRRFIKTPLQLAKERIK